MFLVDSIVSLSPRGTPRGRWAAFAAVWRRWPKAFPRGAILLKLFFKFLVLFFGEYALHLLHHLLVHRVTFQTKILKIERAGLALPQKRHGFFMLRFLNGVDLRFLRFG